MAIYHYAAQVISRSAGKSSVAAAAYRAGAVLHDERTGLTHSYIKKQGVDHTEILAPEGAPEWVFDRGLLWNEIEKIEKRKDSQLAHEINVALPIELSEVQRIDLLRDFIQTEFVAYGLVVDYAIHNNNPDNPHAHLMATTRPLEGDKFGKKPQAKEFLDRKDALNRRRENWAVSVNQALETAGSGERIDHRSLDEQGVDRVPQIHLGSAVAGMKAQGISTDRGDLYDAIAAQNRALELAEIEAQNRVSELAELAEIEAEIKVLAADLDRQEGEIDPPEEGIEVEGEEEQETESDPLEGEVIDQLTTSNELPSSLDSVDPDIDPDPDTNSTTNDEPPDDTPVEIVPIEIVPPLVDEVPEQPPDLVGSISSIDTDVRPGVEDTPIVPLTVEPTPVVPPEPPPPTPRQVARAEYDHRAKIIRAEKGESLSDLQVTGLMAVDFYSSLPPDQAAEKIIVLGQAPDVQVIKQEQGQTAAIDYVQQIATFAFNKAKASVKTPPVRDDSR